MKRWTTTMILAGAMLLPFESMAVANPDKPAVVPTTEVKPTPDKPAKKSGLFGPGVTTPGQTDAKRFGPGVTTPKENITGIGIDAWRLWLVLLVLGGMVGGMFYILRKYGRGILPGPGVDVIKVKAKVQLDSRNSVSVLRIYDEEYVIGAGAEGVRLLARLMPIEGVDSEAAIEDAAPAPEEETTVGNENLQRAAVKVEQDFSSRFKSMIDHEEVK